MANEDSELRLTTFEFLGQQTRLLGDVLPWAVLSKGFVYQGRRVPLIGPQGIFKPADMRFPLSLTTAPIVPGRDRPYEDEIGTDDLILYRYRGGAPFHRDNVGVREAMIRRLPLVYFSRSREGAIRRRVAGFRGC